ncbi:hypothetical protein OPHB3_3525 [Oceanobacillus picturae]|uniref:Uncharacterized protein n=1 Tax=Oceanobacillus picturae TaxID=171693 RepID=A0A0U9HHS1_9BACI|nr:hypothetical protein [Oceanobacillus picturae]GAQ19556.1 hypothetical protein OPHB3_3525 [Oceanobacillus picturae]
MRKMKEKKKFGLFVLILTVVLGFSLTTPVSANSVQLLSEEDIQQKLLDIADSYGLDEPLSKEDAEFVKTYAQPVEKPGDFSIMKKKTKKVSGKKSNSKIAATVSGSIYHDIGVINNSFGGNIKTTVTKGKPTKIKTKIRHVAYGLLGSGGTIVGKVQDKTLTSTCTSGKTCSNGKTHRYTATVAYATTYAEATVSYSSGSISIEAK